MVMRKLNNRSITHQLRFVRKWRFCGNEEIFRHVQDRQVRKVFENSHGTSLQVNHDWIERIDDRTWEQNLVIADEAALRKFSDQIDSGKVVTTYGDMNLPSLFTDNGGLGEWTKSGEPLLNAEGFTNGVRRRFELYWWCLWTYNSPNIGNCLIGTPTTLRRHILEMSKNDLQISRTDK